MLPLARASINLEKFYRDAQARSNEVQREAAVVRDDFVVENLPAMSEANEGASASQKSMS